MLGCQDFCGYYDWTFQYVRQTFGQAAVHDLWKDAIGGESQQHYLDAGRDEGLAGLLRVWTQTGEDEHCDWTFTLDESRNTLRWDMRQCPSKGFLIDNDLQHDEDYCDHCVGWIAPLLAKFGAEVTAHEHNHCGQCWCEMRMVDRPSQALDLPIDIRRDLRWGRGYIDRFSGSVKLPLLGHDAADPCDVLERWFAAHDRLTVIGRGPSAAVQPAGADQDGILITDASYATRDVFPGDPLAVLIGDAPLHLVDAARRFLSTETQRRPLLMHAYLPGMPLVNFDALGLPRPVPILPLLLRSGLYRHRPHQPYPTSGTFLVLVAAALKKAITVTGIDLYAGRRIYMSDGCESEFSWPARHSRDCEIDHLRLALRPVEGRLQAPPALLDAIRP